MYIYGLLDPRTNQIRYVGKSKNPARRYKEHIKKDKYNPYKDAWTSQLKAVGLLPELRIFEHAEGRDIDALECLWIAKCKEFGCSLTNLAVGGTGGDTGVYRTFSEEERRALSDARKGPGNPMYGKSGWNAGLKMTAEHCAKLSEAHKDIPLSEAHRRNIGIANTGHTVSEETKRKIKATRATRTYEKRPAPLALIEAARLHNISRRRPVKSTNVRTGETLTHVSIAQAARDLDVFLANVCKCLKGTYKTTGGYSFVYAESI